VQYNPLTEQHYRTKSGVTKGAGVATSYAFLGHFLMHGSYIHTKGELHAIIFGVF